MSETLQKKNEFKSKHKHLATVLKTVDIGNMTTLTDCKQRYIWRIIIAQIKQDDGSVNLLSLQFDSRTFLPYPGRDFDRRFSPSERALEKRNKI